MRRFQVAKLSLQVSGSIAVTAQSGELWTRVDILLEKVGLP
jgi:hypothetical protein